MSYHHSSYPVYVSHSERAIKQTFAYVLYEPVHAVVTLYRVVRQHMS